MRLFNRGCRQHRQNASLLASGALSPAERAGVEQHLDACPACREYFAHINAVSSALTTWVGDQPAVEPSPSAQHRWARAIQSAERPTPVRKLTPAEALHEWAREVLFPWRRAWAGFAVVWLLILAGHLSLQDHSSAGTVKHSPSSQEMMASFWDQQRILSELLVDHSTLHEADRQRFFLPKPRAQSIAFGMA
jgi:anti-sigma factor RsiW